jgi:polyferredoxin
LRPRVVIYPALLVVILSLFGMTLAGKTDMEVSFLRTRARPYVVLDTGDISNIVQLKIVNRGDETHTYTIELLGDGGLLTSSDLPLTVAPGDSSSATLHVTLPRQRFEGGRAEISLRVGDGHDCSETITHHVLGPLFGGGG